MQEKEKKDIGTNGFFYTTVCLKSTRETRDSRCHVAEVDIQL